MSTDHTPDFTPPWFPHVPELGTREHKGQTVAAELRAFYYSPEQPVYAEDLIDWILARYEQYTQAWSQRTGMDMEAVIRETIHQAHYVNMPYPIVLPSSFVHALKPEFQMRGHNKEVEYGGKTFRHNIDSLEFTLPTRDGGRIVFHQYSVHTDDKLLYALQDDPWMKAIYHWFHEIGNHDLVHTGHRVQYPFYAGLADPNPLLENFLYLESKSVPPTTHLGTIAANLEVHASLSHLLTMGVVAETSAEASLHTRTAELGEDIVALGRHYMARLGEIVAHDPATRLYGEYALMRTFGNFADFNAPVIHAIMDGLSLHSHADIDGVIKELTQGYYHDVHRLAAPGTGFEGEAVLHLGPDPVTPAEMDRQYASSLKPGIENSGIRAIAPRPGVFEEIHTLAEQLRGR